MARTDPRLARGIPAPRLHAPAARLRAAALAAPGVVSTTTFDDLKAALRDACATVLPFDIFTLSLYDAETHTLEFLIAEENGVARIVPEGTLAGTPSMRVIERRASLRMDRSDDPLRVGARNIGGLERSPESVILSPIVHDGTALGILSVQAYEPCRYDADDVELLEILAVYAASAIRNVRGTGQRRALETALRASKQRLAALISASPVAVVTIDACGQVVVWNPAAEAMLGISAGTIRGHPIAEHLPDLGTVFVELQQQLENAGAVVTVEAVHDRPDGGRVDIGVSVARVRSEVAGFGETLFTVIDLSEQRAAEAALRESAERFRYAQKMEAVGRLAGVVATDFDRMLSTILDQTEIALAGAGAGSDPLAGIGEIRTAAEEAAQLTRDLLAFSRRQVSSVQTIGLNGLVRRMTPALSRLVGEDAQLLTRLHGDLRDVRADPAHVEWIVSNLVENAGDAMPAGGRVILRTRNVHLRPDDVARLADEVPAGDYAALSVDDDGHGMDESTLERAFEPFFTTKPPGKGTGLGLSTAYGLARQNGGCIAVESRPGQGSRFTVYLPGA